MHLFDSAPTVPQYPATPAWGFVFRRFHLLVRWEEGGQAVVPKLRELTAVWGQNRVVRQQYLGYFGATDCYAAEVAENEEPPTGYQFVSLRQLFHQLDADLFRIAGRAVQMVAWDRDHQFCGRCATPTEMATDKAKVCPACGLRAYPRLAPAVIMAITKGDKLLLAHGVRHPGQMYSVLAGFVEPGESLEETVVREVQEEVGLAVRDIRYFGSEPWPFPNSLMVGFTAVYESGDIQLSEEIAAADWFTAADIQAGKVVTPSAAISIAGKLIQSFVQSGPAAE